MKRDLLDPFKGVKLKRRLRKLVENLGVTNGSILKLLGRRDPRTDLNQRTYTTHTRPGACPGRTLLRSGVRTPRRLLAEDRCDAGSVFDTPESPDPLSSR